MSGPDYRNEQLLVSYILHNPKKIHDVNTNHFIAKDSIAIAEAIKEHNEKGLEFSFDTLTNLARKHHETIDPSILKGIYEEYNDFTNLEEHKALQSDAYLKEIVQHELFAKINAITKKSGPIEREKLAGYLDQVRSIVSGNNEDKDVYSTSEWMDLHRKGDSDRQNDKYPKTTGYPTLDRKMKRPFMAGDFMTTAAPPGMGKSIFTMNVIYQLVTKGYNVLSLNTEMGEVANADRLIGLVANLPHDDIIKRDRDPRISALIEKGREQISTIPNLLYSSQESLYLDDVDRMLSRAKEKFMDLGTWNFDNPYMVVTIDLFDLLLDIKKKTPDEIGLAVDDFHRILKKHKINGLPYVAGNLVTQINENMFRDRAFRNKFDSPDDLNDLVFTAYDIHGASAYNQRSRIITTLSRPAHLKTLFFPEDAAHWENDPKENYILVNIAKNNYGPVGTVKFWFNTKTGKISPVVEGYDNPPQIEQERPTRKIRNIG
jgi:replicative DNA helicase